ncbi:MAG: hypothetical protein ABIJ96_11350 [Elusimicrobiota bacterium]
MGSKTKSYIGAGVSLVAVAAGGYFLYGKDGQKNRDKIKGWALKAKGEMLEHIEKLKQVNQKAYNDVVDRVAKRYKKFKQVDKKELQRLVKESKGFWNSIAKKVPETEAKIARVNNRRKKAAPRPKK